MFILLNIYSESMLLRDFPYAFKSNSIWLCTYSDTRNDFIYHWRQIANRLSNLFNVGKVVVANFSLHVARQSRHSEL